MGRISAVHESASKPLPALERSMDTKRNDTPQRAGNTLQLSGYVRELCACCCRSNAGIAIAAVWYQWSDELLDRSFEIRTVY